MNHKALLIPHNSKGEIFIQDRQGHKPPPWGFFGGGIEKGETALAAVIRETKEELDLDLLVTDVVYLGEFPTQYGVKVVERSLFVYQTDQVEFTVLEGAGGKWVSFAAAKTYMHKADTLDAIKAAIESKLCNT